MIGEKLHIPNWIFQLENPSKARHGEQVWFQLQFQLRGVGEVLIPGTFCNFYPHLSLKTVFPAPKRTQNCYINMKFSFF